MSLDDILAPEAIAASLRAGDKKQVLHELSRHAATLTRMPEAMLFDILMQREHLGSTGVGQGIAIPHGRVPGLGRMFGFFARLEKPIAYEAVDDDPVDLVFLLLAPENAGADHLKALARVARLFRSTSLPAKLRATSDRDGLYALLTEVTAVPAV